jgi:hypothetical protein
MRAPQPKELFSMKLITNFIFALIKFALAVGIAGGLTDLTLSMRADAEKAHRVGVISFKQMNRSLVGP